jgi:hypothetical protein
MRKKLQIALIILAVVSGITTMLSAPVLVRCGSFLALAIARHANGNDKSRLKDILDEIGAEPVL